MVCDVSTLHIGYISCLFCTYRKSDAVEPSIDTYYFTSFLVFSCNNVILVGNGLCSDETNNADCNYDGGDCCGACANTDHCSNCVCYAESPIDSYCK